MTTKPPSSLAAGDVPQSDEEGDDLQVDASDDVTVEASEEVTTEAAAAGLASVPSETPLPLRVDDTVVTAAPTAAAPMTRPASAPTVLGIPLSSIPLPGVTAAVATPAPLPSIEIAAEVDEDEEVTHLARPVNEEVTRPSITDEDEEETKVEATDPLINAGGADDDVTTALAEQASVEREKALRRSSPSFAPAMSPEGNSGVEFSDPDDEEAVVGSQDVEEDVEDEADEESSEAATANHNDAPAETSPLAAAITRRPPPGAPFGRIPSPTSSFGLSLSPAPLGQVPAPSSSPFGNSRLAPAAAATPFGARTTTGSSPVVQIPAPSAGTPLAPRVPKLFEKYSVPLGGLVALGLVPLFVGLFIGIAIGRPGASPVVAAAPTPAAPTAAPLVQPVATPAPQLPAAKQPETAIAEPPPAEEPPAPKPAIKHVAPPRPHKVDAVASDEPPAPPPHVAARPAPKPQPPAAKPAIKKPTKAWVDPFAN